MLNPNAVLPCGTESARRRHAAHGKNCRACDTASTTRDGELSAYAYRLQRRVMSVEGSNRKLRRQIAAVADWTALLEDNERMAARLDDADRVMRTFLQFPVIRHEALDREHRRLFPAPEKEAAA